MAVSESRFDLLGIPPETITPSFATTPHGLLATKLLDRIDRKHRRPIVRIGNPPVLEQPLDYPLEAAGLVGEAHNTLNHLYQVVYSGKIPSLFSSQDDYDRFAERGLLSLTAKQARIAFLTLDGEDIGENNYRTYSQEAHRKATVAEETGDLATYLMWTYDGFHRYPIKRNVMVNDALWNSITGEPQETVEQYLDEAETQRPKFLTEATLVKRMHQMLAELPDNDKIKIAIARLPAEIDKDRPSRVLTYFPPNSYNRWGEEASGYEAREFYTLTTAPCILHSFYNLYKVTREERLVAPIRGKKRSPRLEYNPRAFYLTSQSAVGFEGIEGFPSEARRFLEVSFVDGTTPIPTIRAEMADKFPQVSFRRNPAITKSDIAPNLVVDSDELHFILGRDDYGNSITQNLIPYVVDSLVGGVGNAYNLRVDQFFKG